MKERRDIIILGLAVTAIVLIAGLLLPRPVESTDRALLAAQFRLRGERTLDSSVVILYFSSDDISILGDLPLKRSYYALLVNALSDLGARAIGFDIGFGEHDADHQEYDNVFTGTVGRAGNVAVSGYFRSLSPPGAASGSSPQQGGGKLRPSIAASDRFEAGSNPEFPFPELLENASGFGHTNLTQWYDLPVAIDYGSGAVPALSVELVRMSEGFGAGAVRVGQSSLTIPSPGTSMTIPFGPDGEAYVNYAGGMKSLPAWSAVTFLQAYDAWKAGGSAPLDVKSLHGKIVLIGIVAEGRSAFVATPFDAQFPTIGIHAMAIHNTLDNAFLTRVSRSVVAAFAVLLGILCMVAMLPQFRRFSAAATIGLIVAVPIISYILFRAGNIFLPLGLPLAVVIAVPFSLVLYQRMQFGRQLSMMTTRNVDIQRQLQEKESLLGQLENELAGLSEKPAAGNNGDPAGSDQRRREELIADVKRFKDEVRQLKQQAQESREVPADVSELHDFHGILYHANGPMAGVVDFLKMISNNDAPVLILGESGTGKELVARAIHQASSRKDKPFIAVNCGALTETLLESELFGHEKGSFTGAVREKPGRFEIANHGVIFLDEIGETSEAFQVKLLRVLQEGVFERVGGIESRRTDVRVIAATNRDIRKMVGERTFREDLYYRLNVFTVNLPPLRERTNDLPHLVRTLVAREAPQMKISMGVMDIFMSHGWKGNIRELQSAVKRSAILAAAAGRDTIYTKDLPDELRETVVAPQESIEESILASLRAKGFSRSAITETASEMGGLNRGTVAEYFRGECFRCFAEQRWNITETARVIAGSSDPALLGRAEKKLVEYLRNATDHVDFADPLELVKANSKPKFKNLAQRYHPILESLIEAYYKREWTFEQVDSEKPTKTA